MDKTAKETAKETSQRKPKTIVQRLKEKNLYGLFSKLEVKHLENIIAEAKNAIPKVKAEKEKADKEKAEKEIKDLVRKLKEKGVTTSEKFIEYSGATETHTVSTTAPETK